METFKAHGTGLVGIDLRAAGGLADALDRAGADLAAMAAEAAAVLSRAGGPTTPAGALVAAGAWATANGLALRMLVTRLRLLDGRLPRRWTADPLLAAAAAEQAAATLAAGNLGIGLLLLRGHRGDPVFAATLVEALGAEGVAGLLPTRDPTDEQLEVVDLLAHAVADHPLDLADLVAVAGPGVTARLFTTGARFPTPVLVDAVRLVVVPLNHAFLAEPGRGVDAWYLEGQDARVAVLDDLARRPEAAALALGTVDPGDLLPGGCAYLDGGRALADVLLAGTAPPSAGNARRVIEWIGGHRDVPLAVHLALGDLAAPWIGGFRSAGLDGEVPVPVRLDERLARAYLTYADARDRVADRLQQAAWDWAAATLHDLAGHRRPGAGFDAVGSVLGIVTVARLDAEAEAAADEDRASRRVLALWREVTGQVLGRLPWLARRIVDPFLRRGLAHLHPTDHALVHWRDRRDDAVLHESLALDWLAASLLWARRHDNRYFAGPARRPPAGLLVDPQRPDLGLRSPLDLDDDGVDAWVRWRATLADGHTAPLQAAGDRFLADSRET